MTFGCSPSFMERLELTRDQVTPWVLQDQLNTGLSLDPAPGTADQFYITQMYFLSSHAWMDQLNNIREEIRCHS